jgi:hypothetical protein
VANQILREELKALAHYNFLPLLFSSIMDVVVYPITQSEKKSSDPF